VFREYRGAECRSTIRSPCAPRCLDFGPRPRCLLVSTTDALARLSVPPQNSAHTQKKRTKTKHSSNAMFKQAMRHDATRHCLLATSKLQLVNCTDSEHQVNQQHKATSERGNAVPYTNNTTPESSERTNEPTNNEHTPPTTPHQTYLSVLQTT